VRLRVGMAQLALDAGELEDARAELRAAGDTVEEHDSQKMISNRRLARELAAVLGALGAAWDRLGDVAHAWSSYERALSLAAPVLGDGHAAIEALRRRLARGSAGAS
jgi:hypothetical protein